MQTEETVLNIKGKRFFHSARTMPEYVIVGFEDFTKTMVEKINKIKEVVQVITETTTNGHVPSRLEFNDVKRIKKKK